MRIVIAADLYWPTINGVATFSRNLAKGLSQRGHEVIVVAPSQTGKRYKEVDDNYIIERTASLPFPFYQNFRICLTPQLEIRQILKAYDPDLIHIQMVLGIGRACMQRGNRLGIPIVSTNHAIPENLLDNLRLLAPFARPIGMMIEEYGKRFHSSADYITTPTQAAIDMFGSKFKGIRIPVAAISNGINLSTFKPGKAPAALYKKYGIPRDKPIMLYIGRLDAEKHVPILVKAAARVMHQNSAHLVIVGHGREMESLKRLSARLHITSQTTITGKVPQEDITGLYKMGTVFCMPSPSELQSIATLEAMASGLPVVAVNAGALHELCQDGKNGYLFKYDDEIMMAAAIGKLLRDPKLRSSMAKTSLAIAKKHDFSHTLDQFEAIYAQLVPESS